MCCQSPKLTTLGRLFPINLNTFLKVSNSLQVRQANDGQCSAVEIYDIPFLLVENKFAAAAAFQVIKQIYAILMVLLRYADKM